MGVRDARGQKMKVWVTKKRLRKFERVMALVAVNDEEPMRPNHAGFCMLIEVLEP